MITTNIGLQCGIRCVDNICRPSLSIVCNGQRKAWIAIRVGILNIVTRACFVNHLTIGHVIGINQILCRAVASLTGRVSYREIVAFERVGSCYATTEEHFFVEVGIAIELCRIASPQFVIAWRENVAVVELAAVDEFTVSLGSLFPQFDIARRIEQRTGMVESSLCT